MTADLSKCSSCSRNGNEVKISAAGPGYYLCDKCVEICEQIIAEFEKDSEDYFVPGISRQ
jgi:ATP-dependent Clp protease ATP-binding subunit ClpX